MNLRLHKNALIPEIRAEIQISHESVAVLALRPLLELSLDDL